MAKRKAPARQRHVSSPLIGEQSKAATAEAVGETGEAGDASNAAAMEVQVEEICVRPKCNTVWVAEANIHLTDLHKRKIKSTPFKHLLSVPSKLQISGDLLSELAWRWDERCGGFRVGSRICHFSPIDVCLSLGLPVIGEEVLAQHDKQSLFGNLKFDTKGIYDKLCTLRADTDVDDFCKWYIALGMSEFYFPGSNRENQEENNHWFKLLDDLDFLHNYSWGIAIYDYLVSSLTEVSRKFRDGKVGPQTGLRGCVFLLQVWALEHVLGQPPSPTGMKFPRAEKWFGVNLKTIDVSVSFRNNSFTRDLIATPQELKEEMVRKANELAPTEYVLWSKGALNVRKMLAENEYLLRRTEVLKEKIKSLEEQVREIKNYLDTPDVEKKQNVGEDEENGQRSRGTFGHG